MKIAIVHDWLVTFAGAEKVLAALIEIFPDADILSVIDFLSDADREKLSGKHAKTTFIQHLPGAKSKYRSYLPLMPLAIEQLDLSKYDLVISSSHAVAKGVLTGPDQVHISYVYSPIRYAWDMQHQYLRESHLVHGIKSWIARYLLHKMRIWDTRTANGVDEFIADSAFIARRIKKTYGRDSKVIYPPVDLSRFAVQENKKDFYLTASRMVPYKRIDLIVEAFSKMPDKKLKVIGDGPDFDKIKSLSGPNIELMGYQPDDVLRDNMENARAFVFAAEEDFGIVPLEAQACGTPVIAFGKGGALETVIGSGPSPTGVFFDEQSIESIQNAVSVFECNSAQYSPAACRKNAENFSPTRFREEILDFVNVACSRSRLRVAGEING